MTMLLNRRGRMMTQEKRICEDVRRQLQWQTDIQSKEIEVAVVGSVVTLSGCVETRLDKIEAENAAKAVHGVSGVMNNLEVKAKHARTDREIEDDINASLRLLSYVLEELPQISVVGGVVTLRGKVRWNFQRDSASHAADAVAGVKQVRNLIEVEPLCGKAAARKTDRKRPDTTPAAINRGAGKAPGNVRPMFFVPYSVGRG